MVGQLILALSILVFVHELGHFLAAKAFGIRVEKFYIFFDLGGRKLFSFRRGGTEYGIGWLPLGGYVKIVGMIDESMDTEQLKEPPKPWEFRAKPNHQKFIVMVAGVVMNVILGFLLYAWVLDHFIGGYLSREEVNEEGIYAFESARDYGLRTGDELVSLGGKPYTRFEDFDAIERLAFGNTMVVMRDGREISIDIPRDHYNSLQAAGGRGFIEPANRVFVDSVIRPAPGGGESGIEVSHAWEAGLRSGDRVVEVAGRPLFGFGMLSETLAEHAGDTVDLVVERGGDGRRVHLDSAVDTAGRMGFYPRLRYGDSTAYRGGAALRYGVTDAWNMLIFNARALGRVFTGKISARQSVASPIRIATFYGPVWDWTRFWSLTALLSMVLAFMNILPIPALDGGHIMFILVESISGRKLSQSFLEKAQIAGMIIIIALMAFAFGNDILGLAGI